MKNIFSRALKNTPLIDRITKRIFYSPDGCWYWLGTTGRKGYAMHYIKNKKFRVSRFMYEYKHGVKLGKLCACHHCDNPLCVNPDHVFPGTVQDNNRDRVNKGRNGHGIRNKLTPAQVLEIRASNKSRKVLGIEYGICQANIFLIINRLSWKNI